MKRSLTDLLFILATILGITLWNMACFAATAKPREHAASCEEATKNALTAAEDSCRQKGAEVEPDYELRPCIFNGRDWLRKVLYSCSQPEIAAGAKLSPEQEKECANDIALHCESKKDSACLKSAGASVSPQCRAALHLHGPNMHLRSTRNSGGAHDGARSLR